MPQLHKISRNNTRFHAIENGIEVLLHNTVIFRRVGKRITLDTGGFFTATTRNRMNQVANEFGLPFSVSFAAGQGVRNRMQQIANEFCLPVAIADCQGSVRVRGERLPFIGNSISFDL